MSRPTGPSRRATYQRAACAVGVAATLGAASTAVAGPSPATPTSSCIAPAGDPNPTTQQSAWISRDQADMICSTQRLTDEASNPAFARLSALEVAGSNPDSIFGEVNDPRLRSWGAAVPAGGDPFRVPTRWVAMGRGQFEEFQFISKTGAKLNAELFSPNPHPSARYPILTFTPGLQESKEQAWWFGESLAEAGYVVLIIDPQGQGASEIASHNPDGSLSCDPQCQDFPTNDKPETEAAIAFAASTRRAPYRWGKGKNAKGTLHFNPLWREVNRHEIGIAGHSLGAMAVTPIGQAERRVKAVVSYDNIDGSIPTNLVSKIHAPALYFGTDYAFPTFAVPKSPSAPPDPHQHWTAFDQTRAAGVDSMVIVPRASTHYEWDQQSALGSLPASRYGQVTSLYFTLAWFDRYLKHEPSGLRRLVARRFNSSADKHSIGAGEYSAARAAADPTDPFAGNLPYKIHGKCVANLLSFYYASAYWLDHGRVQSADMRNRGCPSS